MKRFICATSDGSFINVEATRMEISDKALIVWNGTEMVAYISASAVVRGHISEKEK